LPIDGTGGGLGAAVVGVVDVLGFPACSFADVSQATADAVMAPMTNRIAARVIRGLGKVVDVGVSPIAGKVRASGYPL
jgi:hypothetical protein